MSKILSVKNKKSTELLLRHFIAAKAQYFGLTLRRVGGLYFLPCIEFVNKFLCKLKIFYPQK